ncbi:MAG: LD-carboxypeptidase [Proteobacteria bacterium]|nr:LD-carboxypeptidase [Pseudomonadota bacterium]
MTAPSSGVRQPLQARLDLVLSHLRHQGFVVEEGRCLREEHDNASAPAIERAAELNAALLRPDIAAVMPPWGGERAIEVLPLVDWPALAVAEPKWLLGYSDVSTLLLPLLLRAGWAGAHGPNLMDRGPAQNDPLTAGMLDLLMRPSLSGAKLESSVSNTPAWVDWAEHPDAGWEFMKTTRWQVLGEERPVAFAGRLVGGCLDTVSRLAGTAYGDIPDFVGRHAAEGVVLFLENCELNPTECLRALISLRWQGWFDGLAGLMLGRSAAPEVSTAQGLDYVGALRAALGGLPYPVLYDLDIGHCAPQFTLVCGALAEVRCDGRLGSVVYR